jgi:hypothetical protein
MPQYLPSGSETDSNPVNAVAAGPRDSVDAMADLKLFWGAEIYRLEYLVHLLETGRIKDERLRTRLGAQAAGLTSPRS